MKKLISVFTLFFVFILFNVASQASEKKPLAAYLLDSLWHIVDYRGKEMFKPIKVEELTGYSEGFFNIKKKIKDKSYWMYLSTDGKNAMMTEADYIDFFHDGIALTGKLVDAKKNTFIFAFINIDGRMLTQYIYNDASAFSEGLAYIKNDDICGFIDTSGQVVLKLQNAVGYQFSEGVSAISDAKANVGFINRHGDIIIPMKYNQPNNFTSGLSYQQEDVKFGFIDTNQKWVISPRFDDIRSFSDSLAIFGMFQAGHIMKYGIIDVKGNVVAKAEFREFKDFSDGFAAVRKDSLWGFVNKKGEFAIEPQFAYCDSFVDGLAWAVSSDKITAGYIDKTGNFVVKFPKSHYYLDLRWNKREYK